MSRKFKTDLIFGSHLRAVFDKKLPHYKTQLAPNSVLQPEL